MKTTNFIFLTLFTYLLGISNLAAKEISRISGKVVDQKGQAVAYANVALIAAQGGGLIDGAVSDEEGNFLIESVKSTSVMLLFPLSDLSNLNRSLSTSHPVWKKTWDP